MRDRERKGERDYFEKTEDLGTLRGRGENRMQLRSKKERDLTSGFLEERVKWQQTMGRAVSKVSVIACNTRVHLHMHTHAHVHFAALLVMTIGCYGRKRG